MLLYNVTLIVEEISAAECINWIQETYIPSITKSKLFVSERLLKVIDSPNEGVTYCMQFVAENKEDYQKYIEEVAPQLEAQLNTKFANKFLSFSTLMEFLE